MKFKDKYIDIIEFPRGTIESDIDRIFDIVKKDDIKYTLDKKAEFKNRVKEWNMGLRVNREYIDYTDIDWYKKQPELRIVNYKKLLPTSKYVKQLQFESLNENKNICNKIKKDTYISFPEGYSLDKLANFFKKLYEECGIGFYNLTEDPQPGYYIIDWLKRNPHRELCIHITPYNNIEYAWKSYYERYGNKIIDIKDILGSSSKYLKQLKFEAYEPGQEPKEEIWKHYKYNISARSYNGKLYLYDYNDLVENIDIKDLKKLDNIELNNFFKLKNIKGKSVNSYSDWDSWSTDTMKDFVDKLRKDFKEIKIKSTFGKF